MRVLLVHPGPDFSVHDCFVGWKEALTGLGVELGIYNMNDRLALYDGAFVDTGKVDADGHPEMRKALTHDQAIAFAANGLLNACYIAWPDVVICVSAFFTGVNMLDIMRSRGHKIVLIHTESPYQDQEQIARAAHADISLINDPTNLAAFQEVTKAEYVPHAYRPKLHKPGLADPNLTSDLAFVGTGYNSRIEFFEAMDLGGLNVLLGGNWEPLAEEDHEDSPLHQYMATELHECLDNEQTVDVYRSAKAGINFYRREGTDTDQATGWAMGPREIEMAATGLFYLRDPRPEGDKLLPMLPTFTSPEDASIKLRWWLAHDKERVHAAEQARAAVAPRTFDANARRLLRMIDGLPQKR